MRGFARRGPARVRESTTAGSWFAVFLLAFGLTLALYWPARDARFVSDDHQWLSDASWGDVAGFFTGSWGYGLAYRPLSRLSFALDYLVFGERPLGWHAVNFGLHAANAAWLFLLAGLFYRGVGLRALFIFLFVISPLGHENVAWISGRTHLLGGFLLLGALYCYLRFLEIEGDERESALSGGGKGAALSSGNRSVPAFGESRQEEPRSCDEGFPGSGALRPCKLIWGSLLYAGGLASYEAALSLPLLVLGWLVVAGGWRSGVDRLRQARWVFLSLFFLTAGYLVVRGLALGEIVGGVNRHHAFYFAGLAENLRTVAWTIFYQFRPGRFYGALILVGGLIALWRADVRRREAKRVGSWFLALVAGTLLLYAPFAIVDGVAWRFLYLVQVPVLAGVSLAVRLVRRGPRWGAVIAVVLLLPAVFLGVSTTRRYAGEWKEAGEIARQVVGEAVSVCRDRAQDENLVFSGIPAVYGHASVFMTSFEVALKRRCPQFRGRVLTQLEEGEALPPAAGQAVREYRFDPERRAFVR